MRVMVLGANGYIGWPTVMYFAERGHNVCAVDNHLKNKWATNVGVKSLTGSGSTTELSEKVIAYNNKLVEIVDLDVTNYNELLRAVVCFSPTVIIHYAEQPSGPFSIMNQKNAAITLQNNLMTTCNVAHVIKGLCPECHLIKLGTMGEYGTPNVDIPEGWMDLEYRGRTEKVLFPRQAGSLYHTSKIMDTDMLWYYVRSWGLKVTDLMQGPVYGLLTEEMRGDHRLLTSFYYDEIFGTVVNRFMIQALIGHPLTVYGKGGQTRGYLNIKDVMQCVYLTALNPPDRGELEIYNQITEVLSVNEIAEYVKQASLLLGIDVNVVPLANPRVESEDHYYNPDYSKLLELGLVPNLMTPDGIADMMEVLLPYRDEVIKETIVMGIKYDPE